ERQGLPPEAQGHPPPARQRTRRSARARARRDSHRAERQAARAAREVRRSVWRRRQPRDPQLLPEGEGAVRLMAITLHIDEKKNRLYLALTGLMTDDEMK